MAWAQGNVKRYYYWTEYKRRMRLVELGKLDFGASKVLRIPLHEVLAEDIQDRTMESSK